MTRRTDNKAVAYAPVLAVAKPFLKLGRHLTRRADPEFRQAIARLLILSGMLVFAYLPQLEQHSIPSLLNAGKTATLLGVAIALLILFAVIRFPRPSPPRRIMALVHDVGIVSFGLSLGGDFTAWFAVIYLLIILGYGVRYGIPYLLLSTALSLIGFAIACRVSPYWQDHRILSFNIFAALVVVPAYSLGLLRSLQNTRKALEERAKFDALTGLLNRQELEIHMSELLQQSPAGHALLFCDLDHFKRVNDDGGHAAGDAMLKGVAHIIQDSARSSDFCARLGGDEFCVLIPSCSEEESIAVAERIRSQVAAYRLGWDQQEYGVGISIGIALTDRDSTPESALKRADAGCYQAKHQGRNRVYSTSTAEPDPAPTPPPEPAR